jgi:hypothetical protein
VKIRELVCALVDKMKVEGAPPEKVVVTVKVAVLGPTVRTDPNSHQPNSRQKLLEQALGWCIERYYGGVI